MRETTSSRNVTRLRFDPKTLNRSPEKEACSRRTARAAAGSHAAQETALPEAFKPTGIGIAVLRQDGHAIARNEACDHILSTGTRGLCWSGDALRARRRADMRALEDGFRTTAQTGLPFALRIHDLEGESTIEILVTTLPHGADGEPRLSVILRAPDDMAPDMDLLAQLYDLTPAEAGLTAALAGGVGLTQACELRGITVNTGKGYLKRIFQKTGTRRQSELVALVVSGVGALNMTGGLAESLSQTG